MKAIDIGRDAVSPGSLAGCVLARDLRDSAGRIAFAKGRVLSPADAVSIEAMTWERLHLLRLDPGDVHELEAGARLARAAAGAGVAVGDAGGGHWPLSAMHRGILDVCVAALDGVNAIEGLCVYTLYHGQVVERGEIVARAKIVPFALPEESVERGERAAREATGLATGLATVRPFGPRRVGAVVQESLGSRAMARFRDALAEKVEWFGSTLLAPVFVPPDAAEVAGGIRAMLDGGAEVIAVAGSKPMDPLDPAFEALSRVGATMVRHGVPAHPGSLFWLARVSDVSIVGMPSCGLFSQATVFDLVLPRLLTGERIGASELASMGHGGFLTRDMAFRFPPYRRARDRGAVE